MIAAIVAGAVILKILKILKPSGVIALEFGIEFSCLSTKFVVICDTENSIWSGTFPFTIIITNNNKGFCL